MADTLVKLSGSTDGKGVLVAATSSPGTTVHTAHATSLDIITLWCANQNASGVTRTVTLQWGGTTDPDNSITVSVPPKAGPVLLCDRLPLTNSLLAKAFCDVTNEVIIYGLVVRSA